LLQHSSRFHPWYSNPSSSSSCSGSSRNIRAVRPVQGKPSGVCCGCRRQQGQSLLQLW
jgi:hypothetical protein